MYLYFCGKNINNIKFKYNTKRMVVLHRLPFFKGQRGIDFKILHKIAKRKKRSKTYIKKLPSKFISTVFFTDKQKVKLINRIFRNIQKTPDRYEFFYKVRTKEDENIVEYLDLKRTTFVVS
jgi:hypothetical protein